MHVRGRVSLYVYGRRVTLGDLLGIGGRDQHSTHIGALPGEDNLCQCSGTNAVYVTSHDVIPRHANHASRVMRTFTIG